MKKLLALLLTALLALSLCAAAVAETDYAVTEPTKVVFWHTLNDEDDLALVERIVSEFNASHELITIEPVYMTSYNNINTNLAAAHAAGVDVPGCAFINVPRLKAYADSGIIEALDPYIAANNLDMSDFVPGFLDAMQVAGKQVALPVMQSGQVAYYDADLLAKLGITFPEKWDDMDAYLEKLFTENGKPGISLPLWDNAYFYPIFSNVNATMIAVDKDGKEICGLNNEDSLALAKQLRDWTDKGYITWYNDASSIRAAFTGGDTNGIMLYTTANYDNLQTNAAFKVGIGVPPAMTKTGKNNQLVAGGTFILPSNNTQQVKNAAFQFMMFFTGADYTIPFSIATSYLPTRLSVLKDEAQMKQYFEALPAMQSVVDNLVSFEKKPQSAYFDTCGDKFESYMAQIMVEKIDVEEGWEMLVEEIDDYLADQY